jgi:eukaryotic-like serine/threonine-protein kinase
MSPEQARGHEVDERTDIWSLGAVLYEMLSGSAPFDGESTADTLAAVIYKDPAPISDLSPALPSEVQRIIRKALQKDREERYQSVKDLALDIKDLVLELESSNSGKRSGTSLSSASFSENPTMIHHSTSAEHLIGKTTVRSFREPVRGSGLLSAVFVGVGLTLVAAIAYGAYSWIGTGSSMAENAFARPQISRINTDGRVMFPAVSPDGKYVAYVSGELGDRSIIVRQIATESTLTIVPATDKNLHSVTYSPSGDHIYFSQTSPDFAINTLYQVAALGGTPRKLIEDVDSPVAFSPDGERFAFIRHDPKANADNVFIAELESLKEEKLTSSLDTDHDFFAMRLAWSPDGQKLLTGAGHRQSGFVTRTDIIEIDIDSKEVRPLNRREFFAATNFAWFADGSGFVFTGRETQNGPSQVWRGEYPDGKLEQITNDFNDYVELGLAADGKSLVTIKAETTGSLWRFSATDSSLIQLTPDSRDVEGMYGLAVANDGKIIFSRRKAKESNIWAADSDGKNGSVIHEDTGFSVGPVLTPDGKYIVFNLQKDKASKIWRIDADGGNPVRLTEEAPDHIDLAPQVSADGKYVIFQRRSAKGDGFRLMRVPIEGGAAEVFYEAPDRAVFQPNLSPDGRWLAFSSYDMNTFEKRLHIASIDGGNFGRIERELEFNLINQYAWSADSRSLTLISSRGGVQNLWRQPIDGSDARQITDFKSGRIFSFSWGQNGRDLVLSRGNTNNDLILIRDTSGGERNDVSSRTTPPRKRAAI